MIALSLGSSLLAQPASAHAAAAPTISKAISSAYKGTTSTLFKYTVQTSTNATKLCLKFTTNGKNYCIDNKGTKTTLNWDKAVKVSVTDNKSIRTWIIEKDKFSVGTWTLSAIAYNGTKQSKKKTFPKKINITKPVTKPTISSAISSTYKGTTSTLFKYTVETSTNATKLCFKFDNGSCHWVYDNKTLSPKKWGGIANATVSTKGSKKTWTIKDDKFKSAKAWKLTVIGYSKDGAASPTKSFPDKITITKPGTNPTTKSWKYKVSADVNVHSGPGTGYSVKSTAKKDSTQEFDCYLPGTWVRGGTNGGNDVWGHLKNGGYIADYFIAVGGKTLKEVGLPKCKTTPAAAPGGSFKHYGSDDKSTLEKDIKACDTWGKKETGVRVCASDHGSYTKDPKPKEIYAVTGYDANFLVYKDKKLVAVFTQASTLPDNPKNKETNKPNYPPVTKDGEYLLTHFTDNYNKSNTPAYIVGSYPKVPVLRWNGKKWESSTAVHGAILLHYGGYKGQNTVSSTGCLNVYTSYMKAFADTVGKKEAKIKIVRDTPA